MSRIKDVIGERYSMLTIIENLPSVKTSSGKSNKRVRAICDCGVEKEFTYRDIKRGNTKSCGCLHEKQKTQVNAGETFGFWIVLKETDGYFNKGEKSARTFKCKCICGIEKEVILNTLLNGQSKSCGCQGAPKKIKEEKRVNTPTDTELEQWLPFPNKTGYFVSTLGNIFNSKINSNMRIKDGGVTIQQYHWSVREVMYLAFKGGYDKNLYSLYLDGDLHIDNLKLRETKSERYKKLRIVYEGIKARCYDIKNKSYENYGGRGISVDESFNTFDKFFNWMIEHGYTVESKLQVDRIDNNGNYSVDNCRLVTRAENNRNMRKTIMTWELVDKIRYGEYKDLSCKELSIILECDNSTIRSVRNFRTWNR